MDKASLTQFATRYTPAWCSQNAASVAAFFAFDGSLTINHGTPYAGHAAIKEAAQSFMTAFPDLVVKMEDLTIDGPRVVYKWTLTGTNTGPDGTGKPFLISGYKEWRLTQNGLMLNRKVTSTKPPTGSSYWAATNSILQRGKLDCGQRTDEAELPPGTRTNSKTSVTRRGS